MDNPDLMKLKLEGNSIVSNRGGEQVIFSLFILFFDFIYIFVTLFKCNFEGYVIDVKVDKLQC